VDDIEPIGRVLIVAGLALAGIGLLIVLAPSLPFLGRLPGDIRIERENLRVFIPLGTMLLISLILTIMLNVIGRGR
jgi:hypothetical protein